MKDLVPISPVAIVAKDESRQIRPLGIKVDWNILARDENRWCKENRVSNPTLAGQPFPMPAEDTDWGEQDSLANIPKQTQPSWLRALNLDEPEGDR